MRDVALVTGANSGIGFECARELARQGWHTLIASRDREASARAVQRIVRESGPEAASEAGLDLGSFVSVRAFAQEIERRDLPIRALVCNAGLQITAGMQHSAEGFERTIAVNHLGHFLAHAFAVEAARCKFAGAHRRRFIRRTRRCAENRYAEAGDDRHRNAAGNRWPARPEIRRPPRLCEQQTVQPVVRLRTRQADRGRTHLSTTTKR